jgi:hypothetical protein
MGHYYYYFLGSDSRPDNWSSSSDSAGNPHIPYVMVSKSSIATSVFKEVLGCYRKVVTLIYCFLTSVSKEESNCSVNIT